VGEEVRTTVNSGDSEHLPLDDPGLNPPLEIPLQGVAAKAEKVFKLGSAFPLRPGFLIPARDGEGGQPIRNI
jgi:hypothetical protein